MPNHFEGWYFKQQSGQNMIAFIPAIHKSGDKCLGSVQVITPDKSYYVEIPYKEITISRRPLVVGVGQSTFLFNGLDLNIQGEGISVTGVTYFQNAMSGRSAIGSMNLT